MSMVEFAFFTNSAQAIQSSTNLIIVGHKKNLFWTDFFEQNLFFYMSVSVYAS